MPFRSLLPLLLLASLAFGCAWAQEPSAEGGTAVKRARSMKIEAPEAPSPSDASRGESEDAPVHRGKTTAELILEGSRREVENKVEYGGTNLIKIAYPGGDIEPWRGVCTDLVVRAFRNAGYDLQKLLYEDRSAHPERYAKHNWVNGKPNWHIDHRRCTNLVPFFRKYGEELTKQLDAERFDEWRAGDVVFFVYESGGTPWHVGVVSDKRDADGMPFIVHLFPDYASEEVITPYLPVHSHFRWTKPPKPPVEVTHVERERYPYGDSADQQARRREINEALGAATGKF